MNKLREEQAQQENSKRLTVSIVYDSIKRSNSSLKRRAKKQLEDSIDRVLVAVREQEDDSDSFEGDFDGLEEDPLPKPRVCFVKPSHLSF